MKIHQLASAFNITPEVVRAQSAFWSIGDETVKLSTTFFKDYWLDASCAGDLYLRLNLNYRSLSAKIQNIRDDHY